MITADESALAGSLSPATASISDSYLYTTDFMYYTMTPSQGLQVVSDYRSYIFVIYYGLGDHHVQNQFYIRPVINVKADNFTSGSGTSANSYVISLQ